MRDERQLENIFEQPESKELLITPEALLSMGQPQGDCDDFSMLCSSMLGACGIQCNFVTVAAEADLPDQFTHIYCIAVLDSREQVPLDCSHGHSVGWELPIAYRKQIWPVWNWNKGRGDRMIQGVGDTSWEEPVYQDLGSDYFKNADTNKDTLLIIEAKIKEAKRLF